jgi:predicted DNA-binding protein
MTKKQYRAWYEGDVEHEYGHYSTRSFRRDHKKRLKLLALHRGIPAEQVLSEAVEIGLKQLERDFEWGSL